MVLIFVLILIKNIDKMLQEYYMITIKNIIMLKLKNYVELGSIKIEILCSACLNYQISNKENT